MLLVKLYRIREDGYANTAILIFIYAFFCPYALRMKNFML